jgi:hypothetical protein
MGDWRRDFIHVTARGLEVRLVEYPVDMGSGSVGSGRERSEGAWKSSLHVRPLVATLGIASIVAAVCCCSSGPEPARSPSEPTTTRGESLLASELRERSELAGEELGQLGADHPWAGVYYVGDGLGVNITMWLAPRSGCVARWTGCLGLYGANWGSVREVGDELVIAFDLPNARETVFAFPNRLRVSCPGGKRVATPTESSWQLGVLTEVDNSK